MARYVLRLSCSDGPGIIHAVTTALLDHRANIVEQEQFSDSATGQFFSRTVLDSDDPTVTTVTGTIANTLANFQPDVTIRPLARRHRALVLVSQYDHCLVDLLYRRSLDELPLDVVAVVSNHETCRELTERQDVPFFYWPTVDVDKAEHEARVRALINETGADLVILARYMQILSPQFCQNFAGRVVNIHHSLLPGFKGARPYHQAHARGVKLIGATAHFVTAELDEGPIIAQHVVPVTHENDVDDFIALGRDVERLTLARAVKLLAEDRVFLNGDRTVILG